MPGTIFAAPDADPTSLHLMRYGSGFVEERQLASVDVLTDAELAGEGVLWLDVRGLADTAVLQAVAKRFAIHPLAAADAVNAPQRPKAESYDDHVLLITHMMQMQAAKHPNGHRELHMEQVAMVMSRSWVVTFQESNEDGDVFDPVRKRIHSGRGRIRSSGADYLTYALLDAVVDGYFPVLEELGQTLEDLELDTLERPTPRSGQQIHALKRTLLTLRRGAWPQRDAINVLLRGDLDENDAGLALFQPATRVYLRDVYDHVVQVVDMIETYREFAASLMDVYLSSVNNRMNEVVKVLTIISTIFLPLSFIAGVYGMNFDPAASPWNMPELKWAYGYPFALGLMAIVAVGMLLVFRHFGWIGRPSRWPREARTTTQELA